MTQVVKQANGQSERFDANKLYRSVYSAALGASTPPGQAHVSAQRVVAGMQPWLHSKQEVTSSDVRRKAAEQLQHLNPQAAYMYGNQHHPTHVNPMFKTPDARPSPPQSQTYRPPWMDIGKGGHWE